jgi:hypothetical protein
MKNINDVIRLVQVDRSDFLTKNRFRYMEYALLGYQKLNLKANPKVSVHYFTPNAALLAPLPADFEFYTKVAIIVCGVPYT